MLKAKHDNKATFVKRFVKSQNKNPKEDFRDKILAMRKKTSNRE